VRVDADRNEGEDKDFGSKQSYQGGGIDVTREIEVKHTKSGNVLFV